MWHLTQDQVEVVQNQLDMVQVWPAEVVTTELVEMLD
jgi:hypothetical protein